ncbi:FAD-dependent oxidoreductase [Psychromicrobium sp. YIM B11713]|uniref:FAD-dependent oxidoreductase n=1 Tax=Psychromicrobium sp. YIM B11713 TaxID=3145233 RepID=UPI00374ED77C
MISSDNFSRRGLLATGGITALLAATTATPAQAEPATSIPRPSTGSMVTKVVPGDPRFQGLRTGNNQRFKATPDYVRLITDTKDAVNAVQEAVNRNKRVSIRGGGHCFEDFVCNPAIEVILDTSPLNRIYFDPQMKAFAVEPGARLINVYETLANNWGVTIPGGICYSVGVGGHIAGGGYGLLSRSYGLVVDHLYGVEVVTIDQRGTAKAVVATRDSTGPLKDLWWAHTGGGGGNFGVVTKYWFKSVGAQGSDPAELLPKVPEKVLVSTYAIPWDGVTPEKFRKIIKNFSSWHEAHKNPGTPESHLSSLFNVSHKAHGSLGIFTQIDAAVPHARQVVDEYNRALLAGTGLSPESLTKPVGELPAMPGLAEPRELPWLQATKLVGTNNPTITNPTSRGVHKSAYLKRSFSDAQVDVLYRQMTLPGFSNPDTMLVLFSFGGAVNAVAENATANAQRSSAFKMCLQTFWADEKDDAYYQGWERETFQGMFAQTGGVPVPNDAADGCYINYPDKDMRDAKHNKSSTPWSTLYYKGNYPRLQHTKAQWDPRNFFRHSLSIEPARGSK